MGMSGGGASKEEAVPFINVTPLIDVLLVLLIIFMVISPLKPTRFEAKVPAEPKPELDDVKPKPNPLTLVVEIDKTTGAVRLNKEETGNVKEKDGTDALTSKLQSIFKERENNSVFRPGTNEPETTIFIKAPRSVKYGDVVKVIDAAKIAGAQPIGLQIDDLAE